MNNPQSSEPRPALETEDIKSQLNAIVAPYGILFPESMQEESMSLDLSNPFSIDHGHGSHSLGLRSAASFPSQESLKTVPRQPTMSAVDGAGLGIRSAQGSVVESTAELAERFSEGIRWSPLDDSLESKGPSKGPKSGSKIVKGWKKFRQSLKASSTVQSNSPSAPPTLFESHSSVAEDTRNITPAVSSLGERKALSDLDRPFDLGSDDILHLGPGFGTGLSSKFSSVSLKGLLLKESTTSSMKDFDVDLLPPTRSRAIVSHEKLGRVEGGAVVVDTESIMSLGKMRQYGKGDRIAQHQLTQHSRSSSKHHQGGYGMDHVDTNAVDSRPTQSTEPVPVTRNDHVKDSAKVVSASTIYVTAVSDVDVGPRKSGNEDQDPEEEPVGFSTYVERGEEANLPIVAIIDSDQQDSQPNDILIVTEPSDAVENGQALNGIDIEDTPKIVPREKNRLGQDLTTPQRWRLSTNGTPEVVGSIGERRVSVMFDNEVYLQRLMQDSVVAEQDPSECDLQPHDDKDRLDNAFRVPLHQSVQLASAMFDNGQRIPLVLYYVTEELRARVSRGDVIETIDSLFLVDWEEKDEAFEKLVDVFDQRPFGQLFDLNLDPSKEFNEATLSTVTAEQGQPMESPATNKTEEAESDGNDAPTRPVDQVKPRVSSRDLSRLILRFLKDLPDPLIPADVFSTLLAMTKLQTLDSVKIQAASLLVQLLSTEHRELLQFLLEFLDEVILRSLRDGLEHLEHPDPQHTEQEEAALPESGDKYNQTLDRLSNTLGILFSHATKSDSGSTQVAMEKQGSQTSLYRHYKRDFELKALQEQNALAIRNSAAVFQSLLTFRTTIFGASSFSLGQEHKDEDGGDRFGSGGPRGADQDEHTSVEGSVSDMDSDYEYQSDSALYEITSKRQLGRRSAGLRSPGSPKRPLTKSKTLHSRHHRQARRDRRRHRKSNISLVVMTAEDGTDGQNGVHKKTSADTLCDSAVEMTTNVDAVALAAMQEHTARLLRSQKHLPRPSVATLHSILAEAHSVTGAENTSHSATAAALRGGDIMMDDAASMVGDVSRTEHGEADRLDRCGKQGGEVDNKEDTYDCELRFGYTAKPKREFGFMDFLQEPLDRQREEREIQLVEKEIMRSEITTKFLAANLAGLYPSSSQTAIPPVILPSARSTLLQPQGSSRSSTDLLVIPQVSQDLSEASTTGASAFNRELTLTPKEQIQLPADHTTSDNCSCTYCTTLVQPSQIPVLTRDEYEKAELQSQCDAKDQHIAELLKTVQSLQGEVNILNAKLLFLHDHHTTRPMRRRTLARNSFPAVPSPSSTAADWTSRQQQHQHLPQQLSDPVPMRAPPLSAPQARRQGGGGQSSSISPPPSTMPTGGHVQIPLRPASGSPTLFAEGVQTSNNSDSHLLSQVRSRHMSLSWDDGHGQDLSTLEEDEAMSLLNLDDQQQQQRPPPPPFPTNNSDQRLGRSAGFGGPRELFDAGLRDVEEVDEEPEREGEDLLDEFYYMDAYKTMDQQLYRRPVLPMAAPPRPMSADQYKKHHRMSLPIQNLSKRLSLGQTFRWKGRATAA
ncbi:hypothetical protein BGZ95_010033 [Linnemannia exigua]|uniref:Rho-GAP domain-containing protein n=1 Tax=Linnemannia exigua TaxID=604196 RepID=A0AAD4DKL8_9FUNG|nr:hypothetical protein BGZ95_010033 [Linnemannia exigua]